MLTKKTDNFILMTLFKIISVEVSLVSLNNTLLAKINMISMFRMNNNCIYSILE